MVRRDLFRQIRGIRAENRFGRRLLLPRDNGAPRDGHVPALSRQRDVCRREHERVLHRRPVQQHRRLRHVALRGARHARGHD